LDTEEMASLALASALVRFDAARPDAPIWLLGGSPSGDGGDTAIPVAEVADGPLVRDLMGAVMDRRVVSFDYRGERRTVEPHRLVFTRGHWQLSGLDRGRGAGRQYRCDRFEGPVSVSDELIAVPAVPIEVREDHAWQFGDGDEVAVDLLVDKRHVPWLTSFLRGAEVIEKRDDGSVLVREMVRDAAAFRSFVLTFLDGAEVVAPTGFRDEMVAWLEALA
jgi:predicted DNA-binding transcriptional regulator YafY